jgi:hypothetical protein
MYSEQITPIAAQAANSRCLPRRELFFRPSLKAAQSALRGSEGGSSIRCYIACRRLSLVWLEDRHQSFSLDDEGVDDRRGGVIRGVGNDGGRHAVSEPRTVMAGATARLVDAAMTVMKRRETGVQCGRKTADQSDGKT